MRVGRMDGMDTCVRGVMFRVTFCLFLMGKLEAGEGSRVNNWSGCDGMHRERLHIFFNGWYYFHSPLPVRVVSCDFQSSMCGWVSIAETSSASALPTSCIYGKSYFGKVLLDSLCLVNWHVIDWRVCLLTSSCKLLQESLSFACMHVCMYATVGTVCIVCKIICMSLSLPFPFFDYSFKIVCGRRAHSIGRYRG